MKIEIFSDADYIYCTDDDLEHDDDNEFPMLTLQQLEIVLQAVKKTKEKLTNNEIQDSKNYISLEPQEALEFVEIDSKIIKAVAHENDVEISKDNFIPIEKIEENQKIVDTVVKTYKSLVKDGAFNDVHEVEYSIIQELENIIKESTGKDIEDLS